MKIVRIEKGSVAEEIGLLPADDIVSINDQPIRDGIDFQFWAADDSIVIDVRRGEEALQIELLGGFDGWFGAEFEEMKYRCCGNKCVFCFIDQNPSGLRNTLYFKDEDFRLSFLYGNYVSLSNVSQKDLDRIVTQRLSPLYISVHATEVELRKRLLGIRKDDRLLEKIAFLAQHKIEMHAQIVLCPGWNDGQHLDETVDTLATFYPWIQSVAIVPVGLTKHRQSLTQLKPVDEICARNIIKWEKDKAEYFYKKYGHYFFYIADEFYFLTNMAIADTERYDQFAQIENGIGMTRAFLDEFEQDSDYFPDSVKPKKMTIVTGAMASKMLQKNIVSKLKQIKGLSVDLKPIRNDFYGGGVSVSGLLVGKDIATQLKGEDLGDFLVLPPNCLNSDKLFLDDMTVPQLQNILNTRVIHSQENFTEILNLMNG